MNCPKCQKKQERDDKYTPGRPRLDREWIPEPGIDQRLRRYVCSKEGCGYEVYRIPGLKSYVLWNDEDGKQYQLTIKRGAVCPTCGNIGKPTAIGLKVGYDPKLTKYKCPKSECGAVWFQTTGVKYYTSPDGINHELKGG